MGITQMLLGSTPTQSANSAFTAGIVLKEANGTIISAVTPGDTVFGTGNSSLAVNTAINMFEVNSSIGTGRYVEATATNYVSPISYSWNMITGGSPAYALGKNPNGTINSSVTTITGSTATMYTSSPGTTTSSSRFSQLVLTATDSRGISTSTNIFSYCSLYLESAISLPQGLFTSQVSVLSPGTATASLQFSSSGNLVYDSYNQGIGSYGLIHPTSWASPRPIVNPSNYEIKVSVLAGTPPTGVLDTWIPLSTNRLWTISLASSDPFANISDGCTLSILIRQVTDQVVVATANGIGLYVRLSP
jgi:hypothetical protein